MASGNEKRNGSWTRWTEKIDIWKSHLFFIIDVLKEVMNRCGLGIFKLTSFFQMLFFHPKRSFIGGVSVQILRRPKNATVREMCVLDTLN